MVTLLFTLLGLAGWGLAQQTDNLAQDLPRYRVNILQKIADVRGRVKGGRSRSTGDDRRDQDRPGKTGPPDGTRSRPVVVTSERVAGFSGFAWLGPMVGRLGTAGLVLAMVIFMLLERRALRDRLIGLIRTRPARHHDEGV